MEINLGREIRIGQIYLVSTWLLLDAVVISQIRDINSQKIEVSSFFVVVAAVSRVN